MDNLLRSSLTIHRRHYREYRVPGNASLGKHEDFPNARFTETLSDSNVKLKLVLVLPPIWFKRQMPKG